MEKLPRQIVEVGIGKSSIICLGTFGGKVATHQGSKVFSGVSIGTGKTF